MTFSDEFMLYSSLQKDTQFSVFVWIFSFKYNQLLEGWIFYLRKKMTRAVNKWIIDYLVFKFKLIKYFNFTTASLNFIRLSFFLYHTLYPHLKNNFNLHYLITIPPHYLNREKSLNIFIFIWCLIEIKGLF